MGRRPRTPVRLSTEEMIALYQAGATLDDIGFACGLCPSGVGQRLKKAGVALRRRGQRAGVSSNSYVAGRRP
jgi:hypothetical protein